MLFWYDVFWYDLRLARVVEFVVLETLFFSEKDLWEVGDAISSISFL